MQSVSTIVNDACRWFYAWYLVLSWKLCDWLNAVEQKILTADRKVVLAGVFLGALAVANLAVL